jgi:metallo-beta-lactamase class B
MRPKLLVTLALLQLLLSSCAPKVAPVIDTIAQKQSRTDLAKQCEGHDGWSDVAPPAHIFGNVYMVGTCGIVSLLIASDKGHILIDGATEKAAPSIADNIRKLGFDPADVRYLLSSHEHVDHVGGLATLKRITGAQMLARSEAKASMESGVPDKSDPQFGSLSSFPGIKIDRVVKDNEAIDLGPLKLTAIATPGHSPGGTSWAWRSCEGATCYNFVYADSLGSVSADNYRFSDHPEYVAIFRKTIGRIAGLRACDILITPHPSQSQFFERLSGGALVNQKGCAGYAAAANDRLDARLVKEATK